MLLSNCTYWKIGGFCNQFYHANSLKELIKVIKVTKGKKRLIIGNGTNILFDTNGCSCIIIKLGNQFNYIATDLNQRNPNIIEVGASYFVPRLIKNLSNFGFGGLEHCVGIPATLGGLIAMNGGSQRKSISSRLISVTAIDSDGNLVELKKEECLFGYRKSIFLQKDLIIISAIFELDCITKNSNRHELLSILQERNKKFPRKEPNSGSVFKSSKEIYELIGPPGYIIESLGLKGFNIGGAKVSEKHANFIVNTGNATSDDVINLINYINDCCFEKYKIRMDVEPIYIDELGNSRDLTFFSRKSALSNINEK
ncbi:UDP-N-acetylmuramate dehydrogenase [Vibrio cyclitrophicus]|uniref:UDP-N-acetylmuramate dehydrogenase n=1 Tax=Vibrio cyclitrophicus TaxID=47951 RepID=UPI0002F87E72|nr:UDP-N-acetylmuramate dehydrogenase [Vibrio cyclitrophicus]OEF29284.1 UDP-N-acetylenolpyruvoylglucosamine reductase [Vibrio cyclitrophicus 1F97]